MQVIWIMFSGLGATRKPFFQLCRNRSREGWGVRSVGVLPLWSLLRGASRKGRRRRDLIRERIRPSPPTDGQTNRRTKSQRSQGTALMKSTAPTFAFTYRRSHVSHDGSSSVNFPAWQTTSWTFANNGEVTEAWRLEISNSRRSRECTSCTGRTKTNF